MSNFVQWAQLSVATSQRSELQSIHAQFQAQRSAQRQQALLADMLFKTEQRAKQLSVLTNQEPLVATIAAEEWVGSVRSVSADLFSQIEHKRSWAGAVSRLQGARDPAPILADAMHEAFVANGLAAARPGRRARSAVGQVAEVVFGRVVSVRPQVLAVDAGDDPHFGPEPIGPSNVVRMSVVLDVVDGIALGAR